MQRATHDQPRRPVRLNTIDDRTSAYSPWGIWPTIGFSLIIAASFVLIHVLGATAFVAIVHSDNPALNIEEFATSLQMNGFLIALVTCATMLTTVGLIALFASIRRRATVKQYLHLHPVGAKTLSAWLCVALLFAIAWDSLTYMLDKPVIPEFMLIAYETAYFLPLLWIALIVAAPLSEELFFRGFLFEGIRYTRLGPVGAVLLTSLLWAVIHLQYSLYEVSTVFVLGLMLGVARLKTRSIYTAIAMHSLVNLLATVEVVVYMHYLEKSG